MGFQGAIQSFQAEKEQRQLLQEQYAVLAEQLNNPGEEKILCELALERAWSQTITAGVTLLAENLEQPSVSTDQHSKTLFKLERSVSHTPQAAAGPQLDPVTRRQFQEEIQNLQQELKDLRESQETKYGNLEPKDLVAQLEERDTRIKVLEEQASGAADSMAWLQHEHKKFRILASIDNELLNYGITGALAQVTKKCGDWSSFAMEDDADTLAMSFEECHKAKKMCEVLQSIIFCNRRLVLIRLQRWRVQALPHKFKSSYMSRVLSSHYALPKCIPRRPEMSLSEQIQQEAQKCSEY